MNVYRKPLHPARAKNVIKALSKLGFVARHTKGAHIFLKHPDGLLQLFQSMHKRKSIGGCFVRYQ